MGSLNCEVDISQAVEGLDEIQRRLSGAVRRAAFKGAVLIRDEARARAPVSKAPHVFYGRAPDGEGGKRKGRGKSVRKKYYHVPGDLRRSIYMAYSENNSVDGVKATYHVSFKASRRKGEINGVPYAYMVEFGAAHMAAKPFLNPAYDAMKAPAQRVIVSELVEQLNGS